MRRAVIATVFTLSLFIPAGAAHAQAGLLGCAAGALGIGAGTSAASAAVATALAVPTIDHSNLAQNTITATNETAQTTKECLLDGLVVVLREALISSIKESIISWINNGFEGGPAFVTDLNGFLGEVADNVALDFIQGTELGFLCSPFELEVRLALALERRPFQDRIRCSLSDVAGNAERFLSGDFSSGGWPAFFRLSTDLKNNAYGAHFLAKAELNGRQTNAINERLNKLNWGSGFFSKEKCDFPAGSVQSQPLGEIGEEPAIPDTTTERGCESAGGSWKIVTPGAQINSYLSESLYSGERQLELADEIDEIINALLAQLARKAFTSIDGLVGLSSRSSSSSRNSRSYIEQLTAQTSDNSVSAAQDALVSSIDTAIDREEGYGATLEGSIASLTSATNKLDDFYVCSVGVSPAGGAATANLASSTIATTIAPALDRYQKELADSVDAEARLVAIRASSRAATTPAAVNAAGNLYDALTRSGLVHTAAEVATTQNEIAGTDVALAAIAATLADGSPQCANTLL